MSQPAAPASPPNPFVKKFKAGETLFNEGDPSRSIYIVKSGAISIRKTKGKAPLEVARIKANEVLGELSFFDRQPRSASAVALIDLEVVEIPFENMDKIYNNIPPYMRTIMASLAERLRQANETIKSLQKSSKD